MTFTFPETSSPEEPKASSFVLRDLPLSARVAMAAFLFSVGIGYLSALVQLHFQHAAPGEPLPTAKDAEHAYAGYEDLGQLERLLVVNESKPFNGQGTMRPAFTTKSTGWNGAVRRKSKELDGDRDKAELALRTEREGERLGFISWIHTDDAARRKAYDEDKFFLADSQKDMVVSEDFVDVTDDGKRYLKIQTLIDDRCARCHDARKGGSASDAPLEDYDDVKDYIVTEGRGGGMSLPALAQTTHVHLLAFSMLYGLTGLIVAFTSWPLWLRVFLAPLPLIAQVVDISFWWLGRADPFFAQMIVVTGGIVAFGLVAQIFFSLFDLFGKVGNIVLVVLILAGAGGMGYLKFQVIDPFLDEEKASAGAVSAP